MLRDNRDYPTNFGDFFFFVFRHLAIPPPKKKETDKSALAFAAGKLMASELDSLFVSDLITSSFYLK